MASDKTEDSKEKRNRDLEDLACTLGELLSLIERVGYSQKEGREERRAIVEEVAATTSAIARDLDAFSEASIASLKIKALQRISTLKTLLPTM